MTTTTFDSLGLADPIARAVAAEGYTSATPIQAQAIPHVLSGTDLLGIAQTGTGKTAAFALPILHRLATQPRPLKPHHARVLVLSPTRELASQIAESFTTYGQHLKLRVATVFGGVPVPRQVRALNIGVDVLVATPGRLIDLMQQRAVSLAAVEVLVLDEADQMLDMGFIHALRRIVPVLPAERQTLFFSATMPSAIAALAKQFLTDPVKVAVTPVATTADRVAQRVIHVPQAQKVALLLHTLTHERYERVLVFTRTKHGADKVVRQLEAGGYHAAAIHGNKSQPQRERTLAAFRDGTCRVLVATDIAARGIDIDDVSHVINFDIPNVPEQYVHRIGRTARAGAEGLAIAFVAEDERPYLRDIERLTRQSIPTQEMPDALPAAPRPALKPKPESGRTPTVSNGKPSKPGAKQHRGAPGAGKPRKAHGKPAQPRRRSA